MRLQRPGSVRQSCKGHIDGSACNNDGLWVTLWVVWVFWMVDCRMENGEGRLI